MNFFPKEKRFRIYAIYKMMEQINSDKELFLKNTPLQNLKNILSDADASIIPRPMNDPNNNTMERPTLFEIKSLSKSALQKMINELSGTSGQYISPSAVSRIICKLCTEENGEDILKIEGFNNNINIKKLRNMFKSI